MGNKKRLRPFELLRAHEVMLRDRVRTLAYKRAIERTVKKTDVVLDLGCGTGIFALFAARAGCRKVIAVDRSPLIAVARGIARANGLLEKIDFIRSDIFNFHPRQKADVLLHEHFGVALWDEGADDIVRHARRYCLKPSARLIPFRAELFAVPVDYPPMMERSFDFWRQPYGFDFSPMRPLLLKQEAARGFRPQAVGLTDGRHFLARPKEVHRWDLRRDGPIPQRLSVNFEADRNGRFTGVCLYFRVRLDDRNSFSTGPAKTVAHWGQLFLPEPNPRTVKRGETIGVAMRPRRRAEDWTYRLSGN